MKASELIDLLQELIDEHGDLPIFYYDVDGVCFEKKDKPTYHYEQKWTPLPERIEL